MLLAKLSKLTAIFAVETLIRLLAPAHKRRMQAKDWNCPCAYNTDRSSKHAGTELGLTQVLVLILTLSADNTGPGTHVLERTQ